MCAMPKKAAARGPLQSMRSSESFRDFALEQLRGVRGLRARAMFGGVGLYADEVFFGIVASDVLYLKVDDTNRKAFEEAGSQPFKPYADKPMTMPYYNVPVDVLEDADMLARWARRAVDVAVQAKVGRPRRPATRPNGPGTTKRRPRLRR